MSEAAGPGVRFGHGGRDEGFDAQLHAYAETGQGAAIMINANDNSAMVSRIFDAIATSIIGPTTRRSARRKTRSVRSSTRISSPTPDTMSLPTTRY